MKGRCIGVSLDCNRSVLLKQKNISPDVEHLRVSLCREADVCIKKIKRKSLPEGSASEQLTKKAKRCVKEAPQCGCKRGSFTLEAVVIFPLTACLFAFLLFYFHVLQVELAVQGALESVGRDLSVLASLEREEEAGETGYFLLAKGAVFLKLSEDERIEKYVVGGAAGIGLLDSEFTGDYILLKANYFMKFPIGIFGSNLFWIHQQAAFRKWTGYHPADLSNEENIWVYVTETGRAYHQRKTCPYLDLSISQTNPGRIEELRNKSGNKYSRCASCGKGEAGGVIYITDYGTKYHYDLNCSGLKRTIFQIRISETGGRRACMKCCN